MAVGRSGVVAVAIERCVEVAAVPNRSGGGGASDFVGLGAGWFARVGEDVVEVVGCSGGGSARGLRKSAVDPRRRVRLASW